MSSPTERITACHMQSKWARTLLHPVAHENHGCLQYEYSTRVQVLPIGGAARRGALFDKDTRGCRFVANAAPTSAEKATKKRQPGGITKYSGTEPANAHGNPSPSDANQIQATSFPFDFGRNSPLEPASETGNSENRDLVKRAVHGLKGMREEEVDADVEDPDRVVVSGRCFVDASTTTNEHEFRDSDLGYGSTTPYSFLKTRWTSCLLNQLILSLYNQLYHHHHLQHYSSEPNLLQPYRNRYLMPSHVLAITGP
ncbi:hypothetical protein C7212DRAFT_365218 [Tuber magnatum]|uniref:Uncharacterized protein n=1 Tax=Tuber magnatum TaxID=42249 RepID=A0A317SJX8_9PEZI|nr:hypothetical protein C7212DRAFT_365218 [Tuber magnatum]